MARGKDGRKVQLLAEVDEAEREERLRLADALHDEMVRNVARELLGNVARHADARVVRVTVTVDAGRGLLLRVTDDGVGYDHERAAAREGAGHVGLGRIRRTAEQLGGQLHIDGSPGGGTAVEVTLPITALVTQRHADEELREERRWATALVTTIQDGLLVLRDGRIVQVNDAFCALAGRPREELLGLGFPWPFWPDGEPDAFGAIGDERYEASHRIVGPDGGVTR